MKTNNLLHSKQHLIIIGYKVHDHSGFADEVYSYIAEQVL